MQLQYLEIYLNDHRAGASGGTQLARRIVRSNRSGPWATHLEEVADSIEADLEILEQVRAAAGVTGGHLKRTGARLAERAGRLKLNGHVLTYSPLSRVLELEALMSGVQAKRRLWAALKVAALPELVGHDFAALEERSQTQLDTLAQVHEWAVTQT